MKQALLFLSYIAKNDRETSADEDFFEKSFEMFANHHHAQWMKEASSRDAKEEEMREAEDRDITKEDLAINGTSDYWNNAYATSYSSSCEEEAKVETVGHTEEGYVQDFE